MSGCVSHGFFKIEITVFWIFINEIYTNSIGEDVDHFHILATDCKLTIGI